jgi:four helix bundle protein
MKEKEDILKTKSFKFAVGMVRIYKQLTEKKKEFVISKQCLRSGTAIGALINEAAFCSVESRFCK